MFIKFSEIDWTKAVLYLGAFAIVWGGLVEVVPAEYHHVVEKVLAALLAGIAYLLKAGKS